MPQANASDIRIETKSHIGNHNPMDYLQDMDTIPDTWIDHYDSTSRSIRCISDGRQERHYVQNHPQNIDADDVDDVLYYLDAALSERRLWGQEDADDETGEACVKNPANVDGKPAMLERGKEYTLKKAGIDYDTDMGLVWIDEIDNDYGFPAFLFEELTPVPPEQRRQSCRKWEEALTEEDEV